MSGFLVNRITTNLLKVTCLPTVLFYVLLKVVCL